MTTTTATDPTTSDADRYLAEVAPHLAGLTAEERTDLLDDLAQHLREIAAEPGPPLHDRLGPPAAYAADLLATAGVAADGASDRRLRTTAAGVAARLRVSAAGREVARAWPVLRPAWWVARAYLAVSLVTALSSDGGHPGLPLPELFGNAFVGFVAIAAAIPLSIRLGQRSLGRTGRLALAAADVTLLVFALVLVGQGDRSAVRFVTFDNGPAATGFDGCLRAADGQPITNLYPYDAEGRLLDTVLLYDQSGRPIDNLCVDYDTLGRRLQTEYRRDANGAPVVNAFPRRQSTFTLVDPPYRYPGSDATTAPDPTVPVSPPAVVVPRLVQPTTTLPGASPPG